MERLRLALMPAWVESSAPTFVKWTIAFSATLSSLWVSIGAALQTLVIFMLADFASGFAVAFMRKTLSAESARNGLITKAMMIVLLIVVNFGTKPLNLPIDVGALVTICFLVSEFMSVVENCANCGVPIPAMLIDALLKIKSSTSRTYNGKEVEEKFKEQSNGS